MVKEEKIAVWINKFFYQKSSKQNKFNSNLKCRHDNSWAEKSLDNYGQRILLSMTKVTTMHFVWENTFPTYFAYSYNFRAFCQKTIFSYIRACCFVLSIHCFQKFLGCFILNFYKLMDLNSVPLNICGVLSQVQGCWVPFSKVLQWIILGLVALDRSSYEASRLVVLIRRLTVLLD